MLLTRALLGVTALFLALAVHELGHVVAGRAVGFRFGRFGVGPFCIEHQNDRLRVRWLPPHLWGPFALVYPVTSERMSTSLAWYVAGGPMASLALAASAWSMAAAIGSGVGFRFASWTALASACVFVATAQPFGTGSGVPSDGGRLWGLMRGDANARSAAALAVLDGQAVTGLRPRFWDPKVVAVAGEMTRPPAYVLAAATALYRFAADHDDVEAARRQIRRMRSVYTNVPRWLRADAATELAFWLAYVDRDVEAARNYLADTRGVLGSPHRRCRAESAVSLVSGDLDRAKAQLDRASAASSLRLEGRTPLDDELLEKVRKDIDTKRSNLALQPTATGVTMGRRG